MSNHRAPLVASALALALVTGCGPELSDALKDESSAAKPKPTPEPPVAAKPPTPEPVEQIPVDDPAAAPSSPFAFAKVVGVELTDGPDGQYWSIVAEAQMTDEAHEAMPDDLDGFDKRLDPNTPGIENPFDLAASVTVVTAKGQLPQQKITGVGLRQMMDNVDIFAILGRAAEGEAEEARGVAIFGEIQPSPIAVLRTLEPEPPTAALLAELAAEFKPAAAKLVAKFGRDSGNLDLPKPAAIGPNADCVTLQRPKLPAPYAAIVTVACSDDDAEGQISAMFLLGAGERQPLIETTSWAFGYAEWSLLDVVDLDGDGVDELLVGESGWELYRVHYLGWDGSKFMPLPGSDPKPDPKSDPNSN